MTKLPNVVVVGARCASQRRGFGLRFEERTTRSWVADWAFALDDTHLSREGYDRTSINGTFTFDGSYPGCPHCHARSVFNCGNCGHLTCWDQVQQRVTCAWCNNTANIEGAMSRLDVGRDR